MDVLDTMSVKVSEMSNINLNLKKEKLNRNTQTKCHFCNTTSLPFTVPHETSLHF
jgi:hypothetical protein